MTWTAEEEKLLRAMEDTRELAMEPLVAWCCDALGVTAPKRGEVHLDGYNSGRVRAAEQIAEAMLLEPEKLITLLRRIR